MSRQLYCVLWILLPGFFLVFAGGCNLTDDVTGPSVGDSCDQEGATANGLICEDGVWVEEKLDAGVGGDDADGDDADGHTDDVDGHPDDVDVPEDAGDADTGEDADVSCEPESDEAFCERLQVECGEFVEIDNCGDARSVDCASEGFECGPLGECLLADDIDGLDTNVCDCPSVDFDGSDDDICADVEAECGEFDPAPACVDWEGESSVDCGECSDGMECGLAGPNICGCPCEIGGGCQSDGETAPDNPCMICDPEESSSEFSAVDDGTECDEYSYCQAGACQLECPDDKQECDDTCRDTDNDVEHCGGCNQACLDDEVCDQGSCVDCTDDSHCSGDDVCDVDSNECVECFESSGCTGDAKCHDEHAVCVDECCDFVVEDVFTDVPYSHDRFDIDVTEDGDPMIVFIDGEAEALRIAERIGGSWYTQNVTDVSGSTTLADVRLVVDGQGQPHLVFRHGDDWNYHWRDGSVWKSEQVWDEDVDNSGTDLAVDDDGTFHFVGTGRFSESHKVYYAAYSASGSWTRETVVEFDEDKNLNWEALDVTSDGEPVVSLTVNDDGDNSIYVLRRDAGNWEGEMVVDDTTQVHHMAVAPDDEVMVLSRPTELPHDGLELTRDGSGSWETEWINSKEYASTIYIAIDALGDPHVTFGDNEDGEGNRHLGYTRWDGTDWESHSVSQSQVERAFWQRIAVDGDSVAHMAVYDSTGDAISYVTVE